MTETESTSKPGKTESSTEAQKPNYTVEVSHKELRSREVKTTVSKSHPLPESFHAEPVKESHSVPDKASSKSETVSVTQEDTSPPAEKVVELLPLIVDDKREESKISSPSSPQKVKDSIESESIKVEGVMSRVSEVTTESLKRKLSSEQEVAEKKPRVAEGTPLTTTDGSPSTPAPVTAQQRVPPLKVRLYFYFLLTFLFWCIGISVLLDAEAGFKCF